MIDIGKVSSDAEYASVRQLFTEYAAEQGFDPDTAETDRDFADLRGEYGSRDGCLLFAADGSRVLRCVGLRRVDALTCQLRRLFVRAQYRGSGIGRRLAEAVLFEAKRLGYRHMRLDMVIGRTTAGKLYESLGFRYTESRPDRAPEDALFMERPL